MTVTLRPPSRADVETCGRIIYEAFRSIAERHNFPRDFPSVDAGIGLADAFIGHPKVFGVVAEAEGRVVGSNFLDERGEVRGVGPITVDPAYHGRGVGRQMMQAVLDRARDTGAAAVRLVQDAFNTASLSLYASLGFEAKEPLALVTGRPRTAAPTAGQGIEARPMTEADLAACGELCREVHGIDRTEELRSALGHFRPFVLYRDGRLSAYVSAPTFWLLNHGVGRTVQDMRDVLLSAAAASPEPLALLVPIRQAEFFRWCLSEGLRVVKPMTLMAIGPYQEPRGCFFPSVEY